MSLSDPDRPEPVNPKRLIDAADMLIEAAESQPGGLALVDVSTDGNSGQNFTPDELIEAMLFLYRLGVVVPRPRFSAIAPRHSHRRPRGD